MNISSKSSTPIMISTHYKFGTLGLLLCAVILAVLSSLSGCSTIATMAEHRDLDVQSRMSKSIFLDPLASVDKTLFVQVHNTSGQSGLQVRLAVLRTLKASGWQVKDNPDDAKVLLQVNIRQAGKAKKNAIQAALSEGYGGGVLGSAVAGAGVAAVGGGGGRAIGAAGLAAGAVDFVGSLFVHDVYYAVISDVQVSERGKPGQTFKVEHTVSSGNNGIRAPQVGLVSQATGHKTSIQTQASSETYVETSDFKRMQTRIATTAEKTNLSWAKAQKPLEKNLASVIGNIL